MKDLVRTLSASTESRIAAPRLTLSVFQPSTFNPTVLAAAGLAIAALLAAGHSLVQVSGGTQFSHTYAMILPVLLAGYFFSIAGGMAVGALAGLFLGPWMPLDVAGSVLQSMEVWSARLGWFVGLGGVIGGLMAVARWHKAVRDHGVLVDEVSGLLTPDAHRLMDQPSEKPYVVAVDFGLYDRLRETYGQETAARYVRAVAGYLAEAVQASTAPLNTRSTRIQGDVFGFLLPNDPDALPRTIDAVLGHLPHWVSLDEPYSDQSIARADAAEPIVLPVTAHMGIAQAHMAAFTSFDTFRDGIRAARLARESHQPIVHYDSGSLPVARETMQISAELLQGVERGELFLVYQPKLRFADDSVYGAEALLRWQSPRRGLVPPGRFIPMAEQSSLINVLTGWVLDQAGEAMRHWHADGRQFHLSINVSGRDLLDSRIMTQLRQMPNRVGVEATAFSLELTETAFIENLETITSRLSELRDIGYDILVDDFGTGCSSFAYLHRLPVHGVKIDRSFISAIRTDETAAHLVGSMIDWCRRMGKRTIAEGVEDHDTADLLKEMGCDAIQGYWLAKPMNGDDLLPWMDRRSDGGSV